MSSFGCADRAELEKWTRRLDELGIVHGGIKDAAYGSGVSFRDPDGIALEFFCAAGLIYERGALLEVIDLIKESIMHTISLRTRVLAAVFAAVFLMVLLGSSAADAASRNVGFGFNARGIAGFPYR